MVRPVVVLYVCGPGDRFSVGVGVEPLQPGDPSRIGAYELAGRLGAGGMGRVYLGRSATGRPVAIRTVRAQLADVAGFRARFGQEVAAWRKVGGAFTAPVIDADPEGPVPWLVTSFLPGLSLREALEAHGPLPGPAVFALGAGLAEALESLHRAGIVHRDLKPSNVLLTAGGPRVIDFGIAQAPDLTVGAQAGGVAGSPGFLAPEQAAGGTTGPPGDIFSLGAVLAFAATGSGPFGRAAAQDLIYRIVNEPPRLQHVRDPALRQLIADCMRRDPARRLTPDGLLTRLVPYVPAAAVMRGTGWLPEPVAADIAERVTRLTPPGRPSRRRVLMGGAAVAIGSAGAGVWLLTRKSSAEREPATVQTPVPVGAGRTRWNRPVERSTTASPTFADGAVYVGSEDGSLYALDARTGTVRWRHRTRSRITAAPAVADGMVFTGGQGGSVCALDARTGRLQWRRELGGEADTEPVVAKGRVYVASSNGRVHALDAATGSVEWIRPAKDKVEAAVTVAGGTLYLSADSLQALDPATGEARWTYPMSGARRPAVSDGLVYCGSDDDGTLHAVDARTGQRHWLKKAGERIAGRACPAGGAVFVGDRGGDLSAFDAQGALKWRYQTGGRLTGGPAVADGLVYIAGPGKRLHAVDAVTGRARWTFEAAAELDGMTPAVSRGTVYIAGPDVRALDAAGVPDTGTTPGRQGQGGRRPVRP